MMNPRAEENVEKIASEIIPTDYHRRAKRIIERFVRTAVLIDDDWPALSQIVHIDEDETKNAASSSSGAETETVETEAEICELDFPEAEAESMLFSSAALRNKAVEPSFAVARVRTLNANATRLLQIQNDFVRRGVIFTGFKYTKQDEARGPKLARNADILILDWNFANDNGAGAMKILQELRKDGQLRFVCIFTDQPELLAIKDAVLRTVFGAPDNADPTLDFPVENFIFTLRNKAVPNMDSNEVSQVETLFEDAIGNIATHYSGFIQLSVLEMSAHHRRTMMTHLTRFSRDFDSAVLSEVTQEHSPVDMGAGLRSLLIDEWRVALEASASSDDYWMLAGGRGLYAKSLKQNLREMTGEFLTACASELKVAGAASLEGLFEIAEWGGVVQRRFDYLVGAWLDQGVTENLQLPGISGKANFSKLTFAVLYALNNPNRVHEKPSALEIYKNVMRLEALFSQQLILPPEIMQGTILKYDEDTYFICISPLCDTARYGPKYNPYTFLEAVRVDNSDFLGAAENYCIFVEGDVPVCLHVDIKRPHVFEIDHVGRKISATGQNNVLARFRLLPKKRIEKVNTPGPADVCGETVMLRPLEDGGPAYKVSTETGAEGAKIATATAPEHETIHLTVVGQLRSDFFLMFAAASAGNSARVGVNRVEYIRAAKSK